MTILIHGYESKKALKAAIGKHLNYQETSLFGNEFQHNGWNTVAARPKLSAGVRREFFARVLCEGGLIKRVE